MFITTWDQVSTFAIINCFKYSKTYKASQEKPNSFSNIPFRDIKYDLKELNGRDSFIVFSVSVEAFFDFDEYFQKKNTLLIIGNNSNKVVAYPLDELNDNKLRQMKKPRLKVSP